MLRLCAVAILLAFTSPRAFAQGYFPVPNQLSLGVGVVSEERRAPVGTASFAFVDSGTDYWPYRLGLVWEGEIGATSDTPECLAPSDVSADPPNCEDAAFSMGVRFHFLRRGARRVLPFTNLLLGSYWKGSGIEGRAFLSQHFTLQGGGGIDLRRTGSAHGLRLSVDYRRVFATNANRNQLRFVTSYVLGPPGPRTPAGARVPGS